MNNPVILDSSAIISLAYRDDSNHENALKINKKLVLENTTLILPSDVITEVLNVIGKKVGRKSQLWIGEYLLDQGNFIIIETNHNIRIKAFKLLQSQAESVSFTDCIVMATADQMDSKFIFGFDKVFKKKGYSIP